MSAVGGVTCYKVNQKRGTAYRAALTIAHGSKGARRITRTAKTKREALDAIYLVKAEFDRGQLKQGKKMVVHDLARKYFFDVAAGRVTKKTLSGYVYNFERYVSPYLGGQRIDHLTAQEVGMWMKTLLDKGLSKSTINGARKSLASVLNYAVDQELIFRNVAARTPSLRRTKDDKTLVKRPLSLEEAREHLATAKGTEFDLFVHLLILLGLRRGEILALRWQDIDLNTGLISINGSLSEVKELEKGGTKKMSLYRGTPKTKSGFRTLALSVPLTAALMRHKERSKEISARHGFSVPDHLFFSTTGTVVYPSNYAKKFKRWVCVQGLREIRIHDYRHSTATIAIDNGVEAVRVQDGLGHSRLETTKNIYASRVKQPALLFSQQMGDLFMDVNDELGMSLLSQDQAFTGD
jgi:integrase